MTNRHFPSLIKAFLLGLSLTLVVDSALISQAQARAGGGRSMGRSSSFGGGSRSFGGSRSYSTPPRQTPPPSYNTQPQMNPQAGQRSGFLRNMAGGLAGGFLGSMLFNSFGHANPMGMGNGMPGSTGGGGFGFFEILLFGGLIFLAYSMYKNMNKKKTVLAAESNDFYNRQSYAAPIETQSYRAAEYDTQVPSNLAIDTELASDIFFKIQGAWTRRDLSSVDSLIAGEVKQILQQDLQDLKQNGRINRLENISVRKTDVLDSWQEGDQQLSSVRFTANLLDYTVDDKSQQLISGSDTVPVKFEEDWTFAKHRDQSWQLVGIQQIH